MTKPASGESTLLKPQSPCFNAVLYDYEIILLGS